MSFLKNNLKRNDGKSGKLEREKGRYEVNWQNETTKDHSKVNKFWKPCVTL